MTTQSFKSCSCCGISQSIDSFQVRAASHDGRTASCKKCLRDRDCARYPGEREHRIKGMKAYQQTARGKQIAIASRVRHMLRDPKQYAAHVRTGNAIRDGRIVKQPCAVCERTDVEGHHPDYDAPLDVVWLCLGHHKELHVAHTKNLRQNLTFC